MAVSPSFREFALDLLSRVAPAVRARNMFGGVGFYSENRFFALIAADELYFKADDGNRPDFEALGIGPFRPYGPQGEAMQYYPVPAEVLEDLDQLAVWVRKAIVAAERKSSTRRG